MKSVLKISTVIVVHWKKKNKIEVFRTLPAFISHYPAYSADTINYYISRKGVPYKNGSMTLTREKVQAK